MAPKPRTLPATQAGELPILFAAGLERRPARRLIKTALEVVLAEHSAVSASP